MEIYRFKTDKGFFYDVNFIEEKIKLHMIKTVNSVNFSLLLNKKVKSTIEIEFVPTQEEGSETFRLRGNKYYERTNRFETTEVFGKILFIISEYMKKNPEFDIFVMSSGVDKKIMKIVLYLYNKFYFNNFKLFEVISPEYKHNYYFFVKNKILNEY